MVVALGFWGLWASGHHRLEFFLALNVANGLLSTFNSPIWQSFVPGLVPQEHLTAAVRLNSFQFSLARVAGPLAAGITLRTIGPSATFLGNAVSFLAVLAALAIVPRRPPQPHTARPRGSTWREVRDGWAYTARHSSLSLAVINITVISFFGWSLNSLLPAIARDHFHVATTNVGWMAGVYGIGGVLGVVWTATLGASVRRSRLAVSSLTLWVIGIALVATSHRLAVGLAGFAVIGAGHVMSGQASQLAIQTQVPEQYRGRVVAAYLQGIFLGAPLGAFALSQLSRLTGLQAMLFVSAGALAAYVVTTRFLLGGFESLDATQPISRIRIDEAGVGESVGDGPVGAVASPRR